MQPIAHFLLSIVAGLGVGIHIKDTRRKIFLILILALAATSIDLDHLLPIYQETGLKVMHNIFVLVFVPVTLLLFFLLFEHGKESSIKQRFCSLLCVMFFGHMIVDGISESGIPIFYPFSTNTFMVGNIGITIHPDIFTLSSAQVLMIIWGVAIGLANLYETLTYNDIEGKKHLEESKSYKTYDTKKKVWPTAVIGGISLRRRHTPNNLLTCDKQSEIAKETQPDENTEYLLDFANGLIDRKWAR